MVRRILRYRVVRLVTRRDTREPKGPKYQHLLVSTINFGLIVTRIVAPRVSNCESAFRTRNSSIVKLFELSRKSVFAATSRLWNDSIVCCRVCCEFEKRVYRRRSFSFDLFILNFHQRRFKGNDDSQRKLVSTWSLLLIRSKQTKFHRLINRFSRRILTYSPPRRNPEGTDARMRRSIRRIRLPFSSVLFFNCLFLSLCFSSPFCF